MGLQSGLTQNSLSRSAPSLDVKRQKGNKYEDNIKQRDGEASRRAVMILIAYKLWKACRTEDVALYLESNNII
ncbi:hypothetical protein HW555_009319 [Spodoptera exigua]|uniref:Uncharacterized protein n=1 Tax=Spodoptera exigua TaxID=7107 RepID=A0A835L6X0_SPOEX|nr:hypothetical protein HW555_009319 [Spodoptera exigua]